MPEIKTIFRKLQKSSTNTDDMTAMESRISYNLSEKNQLSRIFSTHFKIFHTNLTFLPRQTFCLWKAETVFKEPFSHHLVIMNDLRVTQDAMPSSARQTARGRAGQPAPLPGSLPARQRQRRLLVVRNWSDSRTERVTRFLCVALLWNFKPKAKHVHETFSFELHQLI